MAKIGVLTFSDGREFVQRDMAEINAGFESRLCSRLVADGHEVVCSEEAVWTSEIAKREAERLAHAGCQATIFNYAVWAFPHFTAIASQFAPRPFMTFSNVNPRYPGLVAMLAAAGALNQLGIAFERAWGEVEDDVVYERLRRFCRTAEVVDRLRGETYGLIGGRPMGMYTTVSNPDQVMRQFGVDIEHFDQWELVRRSESIDPKRALGGREWLERWGNVHYDGQALTPAILERQIRTYYALRELVEECRIDFCGVKGQPELTNYHCTMDVAEAFMNDPYDWDGEKPPIVCATEADTDGALTMEILKHLAGTPVLFADVRHYNEERDFFDLVNSGQHATYFAGHSFDPQQNMPNVHFYPAAAYFPAGGASVQHLAAPGEATFARLTRNDGRYWMAILHGELVRFGDDVDEELMRETTREWPHAFARFDAPFDEFLSMFASNHLHAVYGDYVADLVSVCRMLGVEPVVLEGAGSTSSSQNELLSRR